MLSNMEKSLTEKQPVAVYKTTVSIILYEILYLGVIALFVYIILSTNILWAQILSGVCAVLILVACIQTLKHIKDRIVVTQYNLLLSNIDTKTRHGKWRNARNVYIPWYDIIDFYSDFDIYMTYSFINIHKKVLVKLHNGTLYCIDSDLYDVFFLKRKLKTYWKEFNKKI